METNQGGMDKELYECRWCGCRKCGKMSERGNEIYAKHWRQMKSRLKATFSFIDCKSGAEILDVGCINRDVSLESFLLEQKLSAELGRKGYKVTDIDYNNYSLPFNSCSFDCVVLSEVIEYVDDPFEVLRLGSELLRVLKPKGIMVISMPDVCDWIQMMKGRIARDCWTLYTLHVQSLVRLLVEVGFTYLTHTCAGSSMVVKVQKADKHAR